MKIECFVTESCGSEKELMENVRKALECERAEAEITLRRVEEAVARAIGLRGSPTVLIDGVDIMPVEMPGFG